VLDDDGLGAGKVYSHPHVYALFGFQHLATKPHIYHLRTIKTTRFTFFVVLKVVFAYVAQWSPHVGIHVTISLSLSLSIRHGRWRCVVAEALAREATHELGLVLWRSDLVRRGSSRPYLSLNTQCPWLPPTGLLHSVAPPSCCPSVVESMSVKHGYP
jgi:hypothetical protein